MIIILVGASSLQATFIDLEGREVSSFRQTKGRASKKAMSLVWLKAAAAAAVAALVYID